MSLYEGMLDLYKDISEYNMIDVLDQSQMVGYGVEEDAAIDFDKLNPSEFKECLDFIMAHYCEACISKTKVEVTNLLQTTQAGSHTYYISIYTLLK